MNNLKINIDDLDVGLKSLELKKLSDVVDNEVVKNAKFNTLKTIFNRQLRKKTSWCNYVNSDKTMQHRLTKFRKKIGDVGKKTPQIQVV